MDDEATEALPTSATTSTPPEPPRVAEGLPTVTGTLADADDPHFPDLDGVDVHDATLVFPEARILALLRSRIRSTSIEAGTATLAMQDCELVDVDLTGCRVEGLTRVRLVRCRLTGADFGEARLRDTSFEDCALDLASMRVCRLERVHVEGGRLDELDLTSSTLVDVAVSGCALGDIVLDGTRLDRVDLTGAELDGVTELGTLRGATISLSQAMSLAPKLTRAAGLHLAQLSP